MLYSRSLGPWCVVEVMSVDWMRALADSLSVHFPNSSMSRTLKNVFPRWSKNAMRRSRFRSRKIVLRTRPALLPETLNNAKIMAEALDGVWTHLDRIVQNASRTLQPDPWICRPTYCASPPIGGKGDKNDSIIRRKLSRVIGLAIYASHPLSKAFALSPRIANAVTAIIGMHLV